MTIGAAHALGLSEIAQQSALGEPLRLLIPVLGAGAAPAAGDLSGECVKLVSPLASDLPQLDSARVALEQTGSSTAIVITTPYPIDEPALRVAVQAGCRVSVSREYTVLLDPVAIEPPVVQLAAAAPKPQPVDQAATTNAKAHDPPIQATLPASRPAQRPAPSPRRDLTPLRAQPTTGTRTETRPSMTSPTRSVRDNEKASARPRLQISRTVVGREVAPKTGEQSESAATQREAQAAIEEQTVVLRRQIAELELAMQRVRQELAAAQVARDAAARANRQTTASAALQRTTPALRTIAHRALQPAARATAWTRLGAWWSESSSLVTLIALVAALAVALALSIRRRRPVLIPAPMTTAQAEAFNRADLGEPSVPGLPVLGDRETVITRAYPKPRAHMIPPVFVDPGAEPAGPRSQPAGSGTKAGEPEAPEFPYDHGIAFDFEVQKSAEERSVQSALEREQPGMVARLSDGWGTARTAAQVESYLLTPRRSGKPLSRDAVDELQLLRRIALEIVAGADGEMRPWVGPGRPRPGPVVRVH